MSHHAENEPLVETRGTLEPVFLSPRYVTAMNNNGLSNRPDTVSRKNSHIQ